MSGMTVLEASNRTELKMMMRYAATLNNPVAIRYAKADESSEIETEETYRSVWRTRLQGQDKTIITCGRIMGEVMKAASVLRDQGMCCEVIEASCIKPLDEHTLHRIARANLPLVTVEEGIAEGGLGEAIGGWLTSQGYTCSLQRLAIEGLCTTQGARQEQLKALKLDAASIAERILIRKDEQK